MKTKLMALSLGLSLVTLGFPTSLKLIKAQSEACPSTGITPASEDTRTYINEQFDISFKLPKNYRLMANNASDDFLSLSVIDPREFDRHRCRQVNKIPDDNYTLSIDVHISEIDDYNFNLLSLITESVGGSSTFQQGNYEIVRTLTVAGREALFYKGGTLDEYASISFISPDNKYFITVTSFYLYNERTQSSAIFNRSVLNLVLSSFTFNKN